MSPVWADVDARQMVAKDLLTAQPVKLLANARPSLVVFLSALCPCSRAHEAHLNELAREFKNINFYGLHANQNETTATARVYFEKAGLSFPVLQDEGAKIARELGALKTPHAFLLSAQGKLLYSGGLSDSTSFKNAKNFPLRRALTQFTKGEEVKPAQVRSLGCVIQKEGS